jgi:hypothetical protein
MKKRKLNSKNPRYFKEKEVVKVENIFVKEVKGVKIYKTYNLT